MDLKIKKVVFDTHFEKRFAAYKRALSEKELNNLKKKVAIFKNNPFDSRLKTHKLKGTLKNYWAFAINYSDRIIFRFLDKETVFFIDIGDHNIYKINF